MYSSAEIALNPKTNPMNYTALPEGVNELSQKVITHAYSVHTALGPGLLESSYKECLFYEMAQAGISSVKEKALPLLYKGVKLEVGYRVDLLIEDKLIVEIKSVDLLTDVHAAQLLTYLKLSGCRLGLLFNFNVTHLKSGIRRLIL
jgi:GxxExxY protein